MSSNAEHRLPPALKEWLDRVIVPALLRAYLAEREKTACSEAECAAECVEDSTATAEEGR